MTTWVAIELILFGLWAIAPTWIAVIMTYRLCARVMGSLERLQHDTHSIVSELLASRTLADTGNYHLAGDLLRHSDAHDRRGASPFTVPAAPEPPFPVALHESPQYELADDMLPEEVPNE